MIYDCLLLKKKCTLPKNTTQKKRTSLLIYQPFLAGFVCSGKRGYILLQKQIKPGTSKPSMFIYTKTAVVNRRSPVPCHLIR